VVARTPDGSLASGGLIVEKRVDFVDAYLAVKARLSGAPVASFDRDFDRLGLERIALEAGRTN
jgi:predicted nucleic acid-binding protein